MHRNQLYPGIYEALRSCDLPWYIASSKAPQRVSPLLWSLLGVDLGPESPRLLTGLIPPTQRKIEALRWGLSLTPPPIMASCWQPLLLNIGWELLLKAPI